MKFSKIFLGLMFLSAQAFGLEKDGVFIGAESGFGSVINNFPDGAIKTKNSSFYGFGYGVRVGYLYGFSISNRIRFYASYGQTHTKPIENENDDKTKPSEFFQDSVLIGYRADLNADYIYSFLNTLTASSGIYVGGFLGYSGMANLFYHGQRNGRALQNRTLTKLASGFSFGVNVGFATFFGSSHTLDFGFKFPLSGADLEVKIPRQNNQSNSDTISRNSEFRNAFFGFGYGYLF